MQKLMLAAAVALVLSGCMTRPPINYYTATPAQLEAADIGPLPPNYQDLIKAYMETRLKDAESARYIFDEQPVRFGRSQDPNNLNIHWKVDFKVNSKNSYGGYVGYQEYGAQIVNGRVVDATNYTALKESLDRYLRR